MNRYFVDIDISSFLSDEIKQFVADHGRTAFGVIGCMRYIFNDQCQAESFLALLNINNVPFRAYCRVAGSEVLKPYPESCEINNMQDPDFLIKNSVG